MKLSALAKRMIVAIGVLLLVLIAAAVAYHRSLECLPFIYGAVLGAAVSVAKVILLERAIDKTLTMDQKAAGNYIRLQHLLRLALTAAALLLGALVPAISLWGVAGGVFAFQISLYVLKFSKKT